MKRSQRDFQEIYFTSAVIYFNHDLKYKLSFRMEKELTGETLSYDQID